MFSYIIKAKFRSGKPIDFTDHTRKLKNAILSYNETSEESGKGSTLSLHQVLPDSFTLVLQSHWELSQPSKALVKFSQALIREDGMSQYVIEGNKLVKGLSASIYNTPTSQLTDGQLLMNIVNFIHNTDFSTDSSILNARRRVLDEIKDKIQTCGLI